MNWAATWQNHQSECAPSEDSDQPGHPPSLIRVFAVHLKKPWVLSYPLSAQRRLWSDWADAQADLSLRWAHTHFVGFVMSWLNSYNRILTTISKEGISRGEEWTQQLTKQWEKFVVYVHIMLYTVKQLIDVLHQFISIILSPIQVFSFTLVDKCLQCVTSNSITPLEER